jgi:GNAT superfamily N-acetyltransferase
MPIEVRRAEAGGLSAVASVLGRAFVTEPMMCWPLGPGEDLEKRLVRAFELFLEPLIGLGMVWEANAGVGASVWIPPKAGDYWTEAQLDRRVYSLTDDGGRRWDAFWTWVESRFPEDGLWQLDSVAVEPTIQGHGIGSALIEDGLNRARSTKTGVFLETGTARNVTLYERFGFRVVDDCDPPEGGPHVWFMRWDP